MKFKINRGFSAALLLTLVMVLLLLWGRPAINPDLAYKKPLAPGIHNIQDINIFGYSPLGENMASVMAWGYWQTVSIALSGRLLAILFSCLGLIIAWMARSGGYFVISRISESLMTIPSLLLALSLGYLVGEGYITMIFVIAISEWAFNQKWLLGRLNEYKRFTFVSASRTMGANRKHILETHFLSYIISDLAFLFLLYLPGSLLTVAALEFLGLSSGAQISGLGSIIALNKDLIFLYPHVIIPPVILIVLTVYVAVMIKNNIPANRT